MSQGQILFLVMLILNTFAGYSFCHLLYLQFRQYRLGRPAWGGWTWRALTFVFAVSSLFHLLGYLSFTFPDGKSGGATEEQSFHFSLLVFRDILTPVTQSAVR